MSSLRGAVAQHSRRDADADPEFSAKSVRLHTSKVYQLLSDSNCSRRTSEVR
jgi:hypothetical protein